MQNKIHSLLLRKVIFFGAALLPLALPAQDLVSHSRADIIAATLILEAAGEGRVGMEAVREVIANRAKNKTEIAVCLAPKQFSCWNGMPIHKGIDKARKDPQWNLAHKIASSKPTTNHTRGATHYHTTKVLPYWAKKLQKTTTIKNHIFYK
jgi:N-acetylmuramoyl-L-alanine amidase